MPKFFYTAKSFEGKTIKGFLNAKDANELFRELKKRGLFLTNYFLEGEKRRNFLEDLFYRKVSLAEKIVFTKNLSIMLTTGVSLARALDILAAQSKSRKLKNTLTAVKERLDRGQSLSSSLSLYPDVFSELFLSMVKVGEESGTLEEVFKTLSVQLEKEHRLKSKIQEAMIYPIIILSLMIIIGGVITVVVLPKLKQFFIGLNTQMPLTTKFIINLGEFSVQYWPLLFFIPLFFVFLVVILLKTKEGRWLKDTILIRLPIFSSLVKKNNCAVLVRSLSSLLSAGVSLTKSLEVSSNTVGNFYFKKAIDEAIEKVRGGENLSSSLSIYKDIFPYGTIEMIEVGEETGKTSTILKSLAEFYEEEVISEANKLSTLIEPILIIVLGIGVGLFAFSIIEPLYSSLHAIL